MAGGSHAREDARQKRQERFPAIWKPLYGGADRYVFDAPGFGFDQISGFAREEGAKIVLSGLGLSFAAIEPGFQFGDGNGQIAIGADRILVYGVTFFTEGDFIF